MRSVRCAWRSSNRKMSWGFVHANMPFIESASSSGWRWGRCARCVTCQCCSWPSRRAAQKLQCRYNSPCLALRTWCSRASRASLRTTHPHSHSPWSECEDRLNKLLLLQTQVLSHHHGSIRQPLLSLIWIYMFYVDNEKWLKRSLLVGPCGQSCFTTKALFGDSSIRPGGTNRKAKKYIHYVN